MFAAIALLTTLFHVACSLRQPHLPFLSRELVIHSMRAVELHKASDALAAQSCGSTVSIVHEDVFLCNETLAGVYVIPHSSIRHNGEVCGTGKPDEYTLLIPSQKLLSLSQAELFGLEEIYRILLRNARAFNAFGVLNTIDPLIFGVEYNTPRVCGGVLRYPKNSIYMFMQIPKSNRPLNFGFGFLGADELGVITIKPDEGVCLFKETRKIGSKQTPFGSPTPSSSPHDPDVNKSKTPPDLYFFENFPDVPNCFPAYPLDVVGSRLPRPSRSPIPHKSKNPSPSPPPDKAATAKPSETSNPRGDNNPTCFPSSSKVMLSNGKEIRICDLKLGDKVLVERGKFSEVFTFTHNIRGTYSRFIRLTTSKNMSITLSPTHYLQASQKLKTAKTVVIGDTLLLASGQNDEVVSTRFVRLKGLHNPQTIVGTIVVNGIVASTFTKTVRPSTANALLAPVKFLYIQLGWLWPGLPHGSNQMASLLPNGDDILW